MAYAARAPTGRMTGRIDHDARPVSTLFSSPGNRLSHRLLCMVGKQNHPFGVPIPTGPNQAGQPSVFYGITLGMGLIGRQVAYPLSYAT